MDDVFVARISRRSWKKIPDVSLGTYVARLLDQREQRGMTPVHKQSRTLASGIRRDRREVDLWLGGRYHGRNATASRIRAAADAADSGANGA